MPQKITDVEKATFLDRTTELFHRAKNGTVPMSEVLAGLQKLIEGNFGLKIVDLDADPFIPEGWKVLPEDQLPNAIKGLLAFDPAKLGLHLSKKQEGNGRIEGNKLREELNDQPVVNANLLDWLYRKENQHLIPDEWKGKAVFFWGTIYRGADGSLCVRFLDWFGGGWCWSYRWLGRVWFSVNPAAVSAS